MPISARPMAASAADYHPDSGEENRDYEEDHEDGVRYYRNNKSRSINYILRKPCFGDNEVLENGELRNLRGLMFQRPKKIAEDQCEGEGEVKAGRGERGRGIVSRLAAEITQFARKFARVENKKMEMMRENERYRMEMENKRTQMILESQRRIVDTISRAVVGRSHKKLKMAQEL